MGILKQRGGCGFLGGGSTSEEGYTVERERWRETESGTEREREKDTHTHTHTHTQRIKHVLFWD